MKYYFILQYRRITRWLEASGIPPIVGFLIAIGIFVFTSKYIFIKTDLAKWVYPLIGASFLLQLGNPQRTTLLKILFDRLVFWKVRLLENIFIAIPFISYLLYEQQYEAGLLLIIVSMGLVFWNPQRYWHKALPTPFKHFPYEYIVGFRKSFLFVLLTYFLLFQAVQVQNYNLAIAILGINVLLGMSYFLQPEPAYFVWIFSDDSTNFIKRKTYFSFICSFLLTLPIITILLLVFPNHLWTTLLVYIVGYLFLFSIIIAKYSAYPQELNLPQGILYALSLWFPPMLVVVIPIFYKQAKRKLRTLLDHS